MRTCWAASLGSCSGKITGEHVISKGLFDGPTVQVTAPWTAGQPRSIGLKKGLRSNILCEHHNNTFSHHVDIEGINAFKAIRQIDRYLASTARQRHARTVHHEIDSLLLERWFIKTAVNIFVSSTRGKRKWYTGADAFDPPSEIVNAAFGHAALQHPKGLYNWAGFEIGETLHVADQVGFVPYYRDLDRFVGAHFTFQGLNFLIWFAEVLPPWHFVHQYYRHMGGIFESDGLSASLDIRWP